MAPPETWRATPDLQRLRGYEVCAVMAIYGALVSWLTWPLVAHFANSLPLTQKACRFDSQLLGWALAHQSDALLFNPSRLLDGGAFFPAKGALLLGEAAFGALPLFLPVFALSGNPTLALNVVFLVSATATVGSVHLVVRRLTGRHAAGVAAAAMLLSSRWLLWQWAPCAPNYAMVFYLPWIFLLLTLGVNGRRRMVGLALLMALQGLATVYLAVATFLIVAAVCLVRLFSRSQRADGLRLLGVMVLAAIPLVAVFASYLLTRAANPELASQSVWRGLMELTRLPWGPLDARMPSGVGLAALGLLAAGGLAGARRSSPILEAAGLRMALFWVLVGVLVSFTPMARLDSGMVRLPHAWLGQWFGVYELVREPHRLAVVAMVGLSLASGLAFPRLLRRMGAGTLTGWLVLVFWVGLVGYEALSGAGPQRYARPGVLPPRYPLLQPAAPNDALAGVLAKGEGPVLELPAPVNRRGMLDPVPQVRAMYRSIYHRRPVLNGYSGYWPVGFSERMADAQALPNRAALRRLRESTGLTTVVVHLAGLNGPLRKRWVDASKEPQETGLRLEEKLPDGIWIFSVVPDLSAEHSNDGG